VLLEVAGPALEQNEIDWGHIKAPADDNQALIVPPRSKWLDSLYAQHHTSNAHSSSNATSSTWVLTLRERARREIAQAALGYVRSYIPGFTPSGRAKHSPDRFDTADGIAQGRWIVGGHQPEAFHPGVWFKNFYLDSIAKELRDNDAPATSLHVIIDHDLAKATSIRVPVRASEGVSKFSAETMPLPLQSSTDRSLLKPWHFHSIDPVELDAFAGKVQRSLKTLGIEHPIVVPFCNYLRECSEGLNAAIALSQARHRIEVQAGICNLEIPMSRICETGAWIDFVVHCIEQTNKLHDLYNECLADYRREYNVHNAGQPVPSLHRESDWVELPFWLYRQSDSSRSRLWVRRTHGGYVLGSGGTAEQLNWTLRCDASESRLRECIEEWIAQGVCVRPRALMTTLFLRVFVAEGFVHGIGGGLYDRLTDRLIERFLGIEAPSYAIATATLRLPYAEDLVRELTSQTKDRKRLADQMHDMRSRPELFLDAGDNEHQRLLDAHHLLLQTLPKDGSRKLWHHQMRQLRSQIRIATASISQGQFERLRQHHRSGQQLSLLRSREYSFLLFPTESCIAQLKHSAIAGTADID
jgi:hypothetical protein